MTGVGRLVHRFCQCRNCASLLPWPPAIQVLSQFSDESLSVPQALSCAGNVDACCQNPVSFLNGGDNLLQFFFGRLLFHRSSRVDLKYQVAMTPIFTEAFSPAAPAAPHPEKEGIPEMSRFSARTRACSSLDGALMTRARVGALRDMREWKPIDPTSEIEPVTSPHGAGSGSVSRRGNERHRALRRCLIMQIQHPIRKG